MSFCDDIVYFDRLTCDVQQIAKMAIAVMDHPEVEFMYLDKNADEYALSLLEKFKKTFIEDEI